jgi:Pilus assembly protein, PilP
MKLAKSIATALTALTIALCLAGGAPAQTKAAVHKPEPQKATARPALGASPKTGPKPVAKTENKPMMVKSAGAKSKPAIARALTKPVVKPAAPEAAAKNDASLRMTAGPDQAPHVDDGVARRDPFVSLVNVQKEGGGPNLPPGKAGLVVATVRVDGTVRSGDELIAVVSNPERHVYFVREGDHLYDGSVKRIDLDGVTFQEDSKDAFGKPVEREVTKRIYASAGDQQ